MRRKGQRERSKRTQSRLHAESSQPTLFVTSQLAKIPISGSSGVGEPEGITTNLSVFITQSIRM